MVVARSRGPLWGTGGVPGGGARGAPKSNTPSVAYMSLYALQVGSRSALRAPMWLPSGPKRLREAFQEASRGFKGPQELPRELQERSKGVPEPLPGLRGTLRDLKILDLSLKKSLFFEKSLRWLQERSRRFQEGPRSSQNAPRRVQEGPWRAPGALQRRPRLLQEPLRSVQEAPRSAREASKSVPRAFQEANGAKNRF